MKLVRGMVVSAHSLASEAGAQVLRKGGNAVDAAVATGLMLGVAEPAFSGIGGGGFALIYLASGENVALDYRETAPLAASPRMFAEMEKSGRSKRMNRVGPSAVASPGMISGYTRMLETYGKMKFRDVATYAIEAAKSGTSRPRLSETILRADSLGSLTKLRRFDGSIRILVEGTRARPGLARRMPLLSETLATLARAGPEEFYRGDIPGMISSYLKGLGGILSERDFEQYSVKVRKPVEGEYAGLKVLSMPPPSAGGTLLIQGLMMVDRLRSELKEVTEGRRLWILSRILRSMLNQREDFGDPDFVDVNTRELLSRSYVDSRAEDVVSMVDRIKPRRGSKEVGSTTHYCVADSSGNVVSATETIECYFGSGVTVPALGVLLNDEMHDFDIAEGRPNSVYPGKRPVSSMSPTIVFKEDEPHLVLGGAGSDRIISSIFQVIFNVTERGMNLRTALSHPRIHPAADALAVEVGIGGRAKSELSKLAGKIRMRNRHDPYFGGVQSILIDSKKMTVVGGADPRRMGKAVRQ